MYIRIIHNKTLAIKLCFTFLFSLFFIFCNGQKGKRKVNYTSIYANEFKKTKKSKYNVHLISLSKTFPKKNWDKYQGGPIYTIDSLFYFNNDLLCFSFPTNSSKLKNDYLIYYFSLKEASCPTLFSLLKYYQPTIDSNLSLNGLPKELKLLPAVCSSFNPISSNGHGGLGFWHLNYPQATKYGLKIDKYLDERRDFTKSTKAATLFLKDLYYIYNDWELTLSAYSCGVTTVNKYLSRSTEKTYQAIYPYLPEETRDLVQAFVAMNYIYNYDDFGAVQINPLIEADTIHIDRKLLYAAINHVIKTNSADLNFLNPVINQETFPNNFTAYFPKGSKEKFIAFEDSIYFYQDSVLLKPKPKEPKFIIPKDGEPFVYRVRSGDVLGIIAERYNVSVAQIQDWNDLNGTRINIGQKLTIYGKKKKNSNIKESPKKPKEKPKKPKPKTTSFKADKFTTYTVKSGDNLWLIAKKFSGVSADNIMEFNEIDENLNVGQVLKIPKK
jgi:membrane-bound lytic murein transglycosylase D